MYKVIHEFLDLKDSSYHYHVGDEYPRHGVAPTKERIVFLLSNQNLLHKPVIEEVDDFENALNKPVEQAMEKEKDVIEGTKKVVKSTEASEVKESKPKRTRRPKTANKG